MPSSPKRTKKKSSGATTTSSATSTAATATTDSATESPTTEATPIAPATDTVSISRVATRSKTRSSTKESKKKDTGTGKGSQEKDGTEELSDSHENDTGDEDEPEKEELSPENTSLWEAKEEEWLQIFEKYDDWRHSDDGDMEEETKKNKEEWGDMFMKYAHWKRKNERTYKAKNLPPPADEEIPITTMDDPNLEHLPPPEAAVWICHSRLFYKENFSNNSHRLHPYQYSPKDKSLIPIDIQQKELFEAIDQSSVSIHDKKDDRSKTNRIKYDLFLAKLHHFRERFKHVNVPIRWKEDSQLGKWVSRQRDMARRTKQGIGEEKTAALNALGFVWYKPPGNTNINYDDVQSRAEADSHPLASFRIRRNPKEKEERAKQKRIKQEERQQLQKMHLQSILLDQKQKNLESLERRKQLFLQQQQQGGDLSVIYSQLRSTDAETARLEALTRMTQDKTNWFHYYKKALDYYTRYGHCNIASAVHQDDVSLKGWINVQQQILEVAQTQPELLDVLLDPAQLTALAAIGLSLQTPATAHAPAATTSTVTTADATTVSSITTTTPTAATNSWWPMHPAAIPASYTNLTNAVPEKRSPNLAGYATADIERELERKRRRLENTGAADPCDTQAEQPNEVAESESDDEYLTI